MYASSSILVEVRDRESIGNGDHGNSASDEVFSEAFLEDLASPSLHIDAATGRDLAGYAMALDSEELSNSALDENAWDDLLGDIAIDMKILGGDKA